MSTKGLINVLPSRVKEFLRWLRARFFDVYASRCYSQEGEDLILKRLFEGKQVGFYVDVGAHHPRRFSNTCLLYRNGWNGINIEPNPDAIAVFEKERPKDINIQAGVSEHEGILRYFLLNDPALNSFNEKLVNATVENPRYWVVNTKDVAVVKLGDVLREHLPQGITVDLLTIDVEGLDLEVLRSNDWALFRPTVVLAESLGASLEHLLTSPVVLFMKSNGYDLYAKTVNTLIFLLSSDVAART